MHLKKCINKLPEETRIGEYYTLLLVLEIFLLNPEFFLYSSLYNFLLMCHLKKIKNAT